MLTRLFEHFDGGRAHSGCEVLVPHSFSVWKEGKAGYIAREADVIGGGKDVYAFQAERSDKEAEFKDDIVSRNRVRGASAHGHVVWRCNQNGEVGAASLIDERGKSVG